MQARKFYHRPVIPLTIALMSGIALGSAVPGLAAWALVVAGGCGCMIIRCLRRRSPAAASPLMLFFALGYLSLQPWINPGFPPNHVSRYTDTGPWRIIGVVDGRPLEFESRVKFVLRVERLANDHETRVVTGLLRVTLTEGAAAVS